jgi:hypothetical protein
MNGLELAIGALCAINAIIIMWILYLASMSILANRPFIKPSVWYLASGVVMTAVLFDALINLTICTVIFLDWPHEWLLSQRLKRYHLTDFNWRGQMAGWICENILNPFDPNKSHC